MFCQSCGAQIAGAFCTRCGARAAQPSSPPPPAAQPTTPPAYTAPPPPPQYSAPPPPQQAYVPPQQAYAQPLPPPAKSGSGLKIVVVIFAVLAVLGMMAFGAVWFVVHKVKQTAAAKGIDLDSFTETRRGPARRLSACALLPKEEVSQILGIPIQRQEGGGPSSHSTCKYYSEQGADQATNSAEEALKKMKDRPAGSTPADQEEAMKQLGTVLRSFGQAGANGMVLSIEVDTENARGTMAAFKIAMSIMTAGMEKDKMPINAMREDIKGLGDEAVIGPLASIFMFRKGDVSVAIDGRVMPGGKDAEINIAKHILARL